MPRIDLDSKRILVTGAAGFIGSNLVKRLQDASADMQIIGIDNLNDYYDVTLKENRLKAIKKNGFAFIKENIANKDAVLDIFKSYRPQVVVNLAAQAGVRYSITNPDVYIESNIIGFFNILEACRHYPVEHLVYASSSSVYGNNNKIPYSTDDRVDEPVSLYAATKKSDEMMAYTYSRLYDIPSTGLRFFTVYGPAGRPDMAYFSFTDKLVKGETIQIFNYGNCKRDFTYIDDIITGLVKVMEKQPSPDHNGVRYKLYNIGNSQPENLIDFVGILQRELVRAGIISEDYDFETHMELLPMQPGDVEETYADINEFINDFGFTPQTSLQDGLRKFVEWYKMTKE